MFKGFFIATYNAICYISGIKIFCREKTDYTVNTYFYNRKDIFLVSLFHFLSFEDISSVILPHILPFIL